jgi:hypothetical protein
MSEYKKFPNKQIEAVYAEDWSIDDGPIDINHAFTLYCAWVIGFLIHETEDSITLTSELFEKRARRCQTIPKTAIIKRIIIKKAENK